MGGQKVSIKRNTVQETLVIPLYARKLATELFPQLFQDPKALEVLEKIDYDFLQIRGGSAGFAYSFGALETALRQVDMAAEITSYLKTHPRAAVVNLGCGLDQTAENCDNGTCRIYNLDQPDVIELRNELLPGSERVRNVAVDLNDLDWFKQIDATEGAIFFAAGVFYYFQAEQIHKLFLAMEEHFPKTVLVFDAAGKFAVQMMIRNFVKQTGINDVTVSFYVNDIRRDICPWLRKSKVSARGYIDGYCDLRAAGIRPLFRFMGTVAERLMRMQIVKIQFK